MRRVAAAGEGEADAAAVSAAVAAEVAVVAAAPDDAAPGGPADAVGVRVAKLSSP
jgi:hypothetical protein